MEKHETLKSLEKTKAKIIFMMILLTLSLPSFLSLGADKKVLFFLLSVSLIVGMLYKRIRRLNFKINSIK